MANTTHAPQFARRQLIQGFAGVAAAASASLIGGHALAESRRSNRRASRLGTPTAVDEIPVTYYPPALQKQFLLNQAAMKDKPHADLFEFDLTVPRAWAKAIQHGPLSPSDMMKPSVEEMNRIVDSAAAGPDFGYALIPGGGAYSQSRIVMPGVDTDMFKWWFTWHPLDKTRYMLWFPQAHIENYVVDPERLKNNSLSFEQRLYDNPNHVEEFLGADALKVIIGFKDPTALGLDKSKLQNAGFHTSASGTISLAAAPDTPMILMLHLCRDTSRGLEMLSRYWIGPHPEFSRFPGGDKTLALAQQVGMTDKSLERLAYEMSVHDMTEFNQLSKILPRLYRRFGKTA